MAEWVKAIPKSEVPVGSGRTVTLNDQQIAIFCVDSQYFAVNGVCPHRGGPLGEGELDGSVVTCPWHGWEFDVTTGQSPINPAACVESFPIKVEGEDLYVLIPNQGVLK